ncbi:hypothetical protein GCM10020221_13300 [Streptomyces thioluteus]|uniref:Uncharacterized protein n=1 Tax=Streptomyces thioluteus TaxID=66431 RepID=A0ABP6J2F0_STRTU
MHTTWKVGALAEASGLTVRRGERCPGAGPRPRGRFIRTAEASRPAAWAGRRVGIASSRGAHGPWRPPTDGSPP